MTIQKILLAIVTLFILTNCSNDNQPEVGGPSPNIVLQDFNGQQVDYKQYKGKVILLHFWTDWCDACRKEFPKIQAYYQELHSEGLEVIAINVGQPLTVSQTFQKDFNTTFPMLTDVEGISKETFGVTAYPTNYLLNSDGVILRRIIGWIDQKQLEGILYNIKMNKE